jgi:hypothetical protein
LAFTKLENYVGTETMDQGETVHPMNEQETRRTSKYSNLAANSNKYNFSTFTASKVARTTAHQRLIFNVKKTSRAVKSISRVTVNSKEENS